MLSRLLEGIVHLVEDEDDYTTASEGSATPRAAAEVARLDSGHLTAAGGVAAASHRPSSRGGGSGPGSLVGSPGQARTAAALQQAAEQQQGAQQQRRRGSAAGEEGGSGEDGEEEDEEDEEPRRRSGWNILGGMPFLPRVLELLTPKATDEEEEGEEAEEGAEGRRGPPAAPTSPGGSSLYPTLAEAEAPPRADDEDLQGTTTEPAPLEPGQQPMPALSEASSLLSDEHVRALAAAVPARYRQARWTLLYSTARDGISLQTLLRNAGRRAPTVLVVRDFQRHVFGAYCSEPWRLDKRFFGTGETFVFTLEPRRAAWFWWWRRMAKEHNDYFQFCSNEAIAVGGSGGYALWLDADLTRGLSRNCTTFGNSSLAGQEEFQVGTVELWGLS
ncbi:nuclear receptor coactivator 7-like isoform X2 [Chlorella sorokiniana]|uniref:Oxidation resistance protein 1 n=1 Tax=Chlorella sorokiniana TaxID=3076 RepID=A0A2P6TUJ9_CHLSO|nr:nuclear receptor coactivator 7-like isoform X2 [Chlorella sorokiniana]|eukprot:PRW57748.1 nuclear receptor coactivator 7-like isoform X2 [Chlorella sorokiniana]